MKKASDKKVYKTKKFRIVTLKKSWFLTFPDLLVKICRKTFYIVFYYYIILYIIIKNSLSSKLDQELSEYVWFMGLSPKLWSPITFKHTDRQTDKH